MSNNNTRSLSARKGLEENLFEKISELSHNNSDKEAFQKLSEDFLLDDSVILGTSSFYDFIKAENRDHKVHICNGTACMVADTQKDLNDKLEDHFDKKEIGHAACLGRCHSNNAVMFHNKTYSINSNADLQDLLNDRYQKNRYKIGANTTIILTSEKIIEEVKTSNLRGRGGAGFPFWFKLDAVSMEDHTQKYIVCNADEGDPGAYSDMYLMEHQAHKVLFGMYIAGKCVGADTGVLYIRGEYPDSIRIVNEAIEELKAENLIPDFNFKIISGQGSYVCGEETALLNSIEGLRPEVRVRPPGS